MLKKHPQVSGFYKALHSVQNFCLAKLKLQWAQQGTTLAPIHKKLKSSACFQYYPDTHKYKQCTPLLSFHFLSPTSVGLYRGLASAESTLPVRSSWQSLHTVSLASHTDH